MRKYTSLLVLVLVVILAAGCKTNRANSNKNKYKGLDTKAILSKHDATRTKFKTAYIKGKADFEGSGKSLSVSYKIAIKKDRLIVINVTKFGIPGAMMKITPDSIYVRMPLERKAIICDYSFVSNIVGFEADFNMVQNMLIGDATFFDNAKLFAKSPTPVELQGSQSKYEVSWFLNGSTFKLEKMAIKDSNLASESVVTYADFERVNSRLVPMQMILVATQPSAVRIELKHSDINFDNEKTNFSFRIPKSYKVNPCGKI